MMEGWGNRVQITFTDLNSLFTQSPPKQSHCSLSGRCMKNLQGTKKKVRSEGDVMASLSRVPHSFHAASLIVVIGGFKTINLSENSIMKQEELFPVFIIVNVCFIKRVDNQRYRDLSADILIDGLPSGGQFT